MADAPEKPDQDDGVPSESPADATTSERSVDAAPSERSADVVIVGGGPAGCSAGVFTARYGLDTVIFDRGNAALRRSAFLANYLGFPAGIDIDTFYDLMHDHVAEAGCEFVADMVTAISRPNAESATRFVVETQDGRSVRTDRVIAAAWYDGEYLRPLGGDDMFELHEHHGEQKERFDPDYPDRDGRTPVDGLYVAAPAGHRNAQAIVSAGQGAHVARSLIEDCRLDAGYPESAVSRHYDWLRPESDFSGEWADRDRWREWFENELPDDHDLDDDRLVELRERYIDRAFESKRSAQAVERRTERAQRRLLSSLDDDLVLERAREIDADANAVDAEVDQ